jgi:hypothetical protein
MIAFANLLDLNRVRAYPQKLWLMPLGAQTLAAFGTARLKHTTTANGGHARAKTMATLTNQIAGLESPFHDGIS